MNPAAYPLRLYADRSCPLCEAEMQGLAGRDSDGRLRRYCASSSPFCTIQCR